MPLSVTKSVQIGRSTTVVYAYLSDPANMPAWAVHNVQSIKPAGNGVWDIETPRGTGQFVSHFQASHGILDHDFINAAGRWHAPARVVPAGTADSVYVVTFTKPEGLPLEAFESGMKLLDEELQAMKSCIEALPFTT